LEIKIDLPNDVRSNHSLCFLIFYLLQLPS